MGPSFSDADFQAAWSPFLARSESASSFLTLVAYQGRDDEPDPLETQKRREDIETILALGLKDAIQSGGALAFGRELVSLALHGPVSDEPNLHLRDDFENVSAWAVYQGRESDALFLHSCFSLALHRFQAKKRDILSEMRCAFLAELESQALLTAAAERPRSRTPSL